MPSRSDTSDTLTMSTEDLLDFESASKSGSARRALNDDVVQLMTPDNKVVKMKLTILALHSPVLRKRLEDDEDLSVLQVTGSQKAWQTILRLFEEPDTATPLIPLDDVCGAIPLASTCKMHMVENTLMTIAM